jgi:uncharacterized membrane protein YhaH (DUF805 family)
MLFKYFKIATFDKFATFSGRARRAEFWYFMLAYIIFSVISSMLDDIFKTRFLSGTSGIISLVVYILLFIPGLSVSVRRLHDINVSGWWILMMYIPLLLIFLIFALLILGTFFSDKKIVIGLLLLSLAINLVFFFLFAKSGTKGPNKFGQDPKQNEHTLEDHLIE